MAIIGHIAASEINSREDFARALRWAIEDLFKGATVERFDLNGVPDRSVLEVGIDCADLTFRVDVSYVVGEVNACALGDSPEE